jgi:diketogulonate reductase-like aldo/keto reductase
MTDQRTVRLADDVAMPMIGLGTWQASGRRAYEAVRHALDVGYRHIDTATIYGNEREVGRAVRDSGVPRPELFLTTKLPPDRAGKERETLGDSLRALGQEYVDLWLIHWPPRGQARPQTWQALLAARDEGRTRAVGVSNYSVTQIDELIGATGQAPAVNQIPWSPWEHDATVLAENQARGVVVEGYSPFKRSDLRHPVLAAIATAHLVSPAQVVLRWHLQHGIVVIPKSVRPERLESNLDLYGFTLTAEEMNRVDALAAAG